MKYWTMGVEKRLPAKADLVFAANGSYRGQSGSWMNVRKNGQTIGIAFKAGFRQQVQPKAERGFQVIPDIEPFQNVAIDRNQIIGGRRQRRDMMRAYGVVDGNDAPTKRTYDHRAHQRSVVESLKKSYYQHTGEYA